VTAWAQNGSVTILQNGEIDSVAFIEKDAARFDHEGTSYTREQFEKLVRGA